MIITELLLTEKILPEGATRHIVVRPIQPSPLKLRDQQVHHVFPTSWIRDAADVEPVYVCFLGPLLEHVGHFLNRAYWTWMKTAESHPHSQPSWRPLLLRLVFASGQALENSLDRHGLRYLAQI